MQYRILITSILGRKGVVVELPDNSQTQERIKKGIIAECKPRTVLHKPTQTKVVKPSEKKAKQK